MSTSGRTAAADATGDLAGAVREAGFVHLVAAADGDALAAAGLLARGCRAADVPFQASVARTDAERERRLAGAKRESRGASNHERRGDERDDLAVLVGDRRGAADHVVPAEDHVVSAREHPASATAHAVATELGAEPAPTLALAGAAAAGVLPGAGSTADLLEAAEKTHGVERRPGIAIPVEDVAEGLAYQTLVHADFAGDPDRAAELARQAGIDVDVDADGDHADADGDHADADGDHADADGDHADADRQRLASLVALEAAGDDLAPPRTADALERALRPYATPDGPFATVGGFADVLEATARVAPGIGVALALEGTHHEAALDAWRDHGRAAHAAVRSATTGRYDGLLAVRLDEPGPVETVARLVLDARSPEPAVLAVDDAAAAAVAAPDADLDAGAGIRAAVAAVGGEAGGHASRAYARHEGEPGAFVTAFREAEP